MLSSNGRVNGRLIFFFYPIRSDKSSKFRGGLLGYGKFVSKFPLESSLIPRRVSLESSNSSCLGLVENAIRG